VDSQPSESKRKNLYMSDAFKQAKRRAR
jgi:hypothetical protein